MRLLLVDGYKYGVSEWSCSELLEGVEFASYRVMKLLLQSGIRNNVEHRLECRLFARQYVLICDS